MSEVELKLVISPSGAPAVAEVLGLDPQVSQLVATYFDTPKRRLARHGISLRLRRSGGKVIQTVKVDGPSSAGLFDRSECEQEVSGERPIIDDTTPIGALVGNKAAKLRPAFTVKVERQTWLASEGPSKIEAVLDLGAALADGRTAPIHELELELRCGPLAGLFALGRKLDAAAPVRLGVQTKADRGWSLLEPVPAAYKAEPITLAKDTTVSQAMQKICQSCIRQFRRNEDLLLEAGGSDALHQARVAIRRLRSALGTFKRLIADDLQTTKLTGDLRWLAFELGEVRNLDVLIRRVQPGALKERLEAGRADAYNNVASALSSARARLLFVDLACWLADGAWLRHDATAALRAAPAEEHAASSLDRLRRRIKRGGPALGGPDDEPRHELRKDAKRLRYAAEFFTPLFDEPRERRRRKKFLAELEQLQDTLGHLNDLATGPDVLRKLSIQDDPEAQQLLLSSDKDTHLQAAATAHAGLMKVKPFWRSVVPAT